MCDRTRHGLTANDKTAGLKDRKYPGPAVFLSIFVRNFYLTKIINNDRISP